MHLRPKKLIRCQKLRLPRLSHFRAPLCQSIPLPKLGTWHPSSQKLMCRMSSARSFLKKSAFQLRNYWLWLQRSGGISRKQPPKRLPALPAEAQSKVAHHVATFSMDKHHEHFSAEPALPLWMIEVTLDHTVMVTGIIDSGCQVVIIRKDIWE